MTRTVRLRYLAEVNPPTPAFDQVRDDEAVTFMPLETVWADSRVDTSRSRLKSEVSTGYVRFVNGDILSPKVTPTFQAGRSALITTMRTPAGAASTEVHVVRARTGVADARFLRYCLLTKSFLEEGVSRFQGVAGLQRVPDEFLRDLPLCAFDLSGQRRVADFLDDQVARIDNIVAARRRQIALIDSQRASELDSLLVDPALPTARLALFAGIQSGITVDGSREAIDPIEVPYLRVANVQAGTLDLDEVKSISVSRSQMARYLLRDGDVLMTEGGDIDKLGRGTVWRSQIAGTVHQNHVFAVRADQSQLIPEYLAYVTATSPARSYFEQTGNRTTNLASTSATKVLDLRIPVRSIDDQARVVRAVEVADTRSRFGSQLLVESVNRIEAMKQSLITAAVTGELDVSAADGSRALT